MSAMTNAANRHRLAARWPSPGSWLVDISPGLAKNKVQIIHSYRPALDRGETSVVEHAHDVRDGNMAVSVKVRKQPSASGTPEIDG